MIIKGYLFSVGYAIVCLLLSLLLYKLGMPKKFTRKIVHILVGFEWVILQHFFGPGIYFLSVCLLFTVLLFVSHKAKLMPMISSDADNAPGTVYYGLAMSVGGTVALFVPDIIVPFGIGIMCTSIGDGLAGVVGQLVTSRNPKIWGNKSLLGTLTNFVACFVSAIIISKVYGAEIGVLYCALIALLSVELELITPLGLDNISITWGTTAFAYFVMTCGTASSYILPIILTVPVICFVCKKDALSSGGLIVAIILDIAVSVFLGNFGFVLLCAFFFGSLLVDKLKKRAKGENFARGIKEGRRDAMQVTANGAVAGICAVIYLVSRSHLMIIGFVTALAEAFSDTVGSGIGAFAKNTYDPFRFKKCSNGLSGGMSALGTFASLVGAFVIAMIAFAFKVIDFNILWVVSASAFAGSLFDSFLGSVFQVKYKCSLCGAITEKTVHHDKPTVKYSGFEAVDNDIVNLLSCIFAVILAVFIGAIL